MIYDEYLDALFLVKLLHLLWNWLSRLKPCVNSTHWINIFLVYWSGGVRGLMTRIHLCLYFGLNYLQKMPFPSKFRKAVRSKIWADLYGRFGWPLNAAASPYRSEASVFLIVNWDIKRLRNTNKLHVSRCLHQKLILLSNNSLSMSNAIYVEVCFSLLR